MNKVKNITNYESILKQTNIIINNNNSYNIFSIILN